MSFNAFILATAALFATFRPAAAAEPSGEHAVELVERFGVHHPEQLAEFDLPSPLPEGPWLARDERGGSRPVQVLQGRQRVVIQTDLPARATRRWELVRGNASPPVREPVDVRAHAGGMELGNRRVGVRLAASGSPAATNAPAPLLALRLGEGSWLGPGTNRITFAGGHEELRVTGLEVRVIEAGPLVAVAEVIYSLARPELVYGQTVLAPRGPGRYVARVRLEAGQPVVMVAEETDTQFAWRLDLPGLQLDQARYRGHHATDARWGVEPDRRTYRPAHERPQMDAVMDLPFDRDYVPGWRMNSEDRLFRRVPAWDPWVVDGGWYWQFYAKDGGSNAPLLGLFAGRASLARDVGEAGAGLCIRGAARTVGLASSAQHRTGSAQLQPKPRFEWGIFAGTKADLVPPEEVQSIAQQMNLHAGFHLTKLAALPAGFPDPPQGYGSPFMPRAAVEKLRQALRADAEGVHGRGIAGELSRKDPQARNLIEFWTDPSPENVSAIVGKAERLARDLVEALVNRDGIYDFRFHYWLGGLEMSRMLAEMDQALAAERLDAGDKAKLQAVAALFAAVLWDNDFVPMDNSRGINLGTPNMPSQQAGYRDQYALFLVADPQMRRRAEAAVERVNQVVQEEINEHGAHRACVHYIGASMGPTLTLMQQMQQAGVMDFFREEPRLAGFAEFLLQCATPPEARFGGLRKQISVGDSATESSELFGQLGTAFAASNPGLSRRLMGMWRAQGSPHSSFHGTTLLKIDATLPGIEPHPQSASIPGYLSVLRHAVGKPNESAVWLLSGNQPVDHVHADEGEVIVYAQGAPVSLDWGSMYEPRSAGAWMHSIALPERMFGKPWDTDSVPVDFSGDVWGNYSGTGTTIEQFESGEHGGWVRSRMLAPDRSFTWTRALSAVDLADHVSVVAIQDSFVGEGSRGAKLFTLNLCSEGAVETPSGRVTPTTRLRGYESHHGDRRENPSAGKLFSLTGGVSRLRFTGQVWPKHPAGGVDFDAYVVSEQPQLASIGHWAHAWHPGTERQQFKEANGRPFEEGQQVLRLRGESGFRVVLVVSPKNRTRPEAQVRLAGEAIFVEVDGRTAALHEAGGWEFHGR